VILLAGLPLAARTQGLENGARDVHFVPLHPLDRTALDRREARKLYAQAVLQQRADCLLEATRLFEEAQKLDPEALPCLKALIPLYVALCRPEEALATCRRALDLDPGDYETWHLHGQQLKARGQPREAREALARAAACRGLEEHPDQRVRIYFDLGVLCEETQEYGRAITAFEEVTKILESPESLLALGPFDRDRLVEQAAATQERIGSLCLQTRAYARAEAAFRRAQQILDPGGGRGRGAEVPNPAEAAFRKAQASRLNYNLAKVGLAQGKPLEALRSLDDYLRTQPQSTEGYELKVSLLRQLGRDADIVPMLTAYVGRDPHNRALRLLMAREFGQAGQAEQAEAVYKALAEQSPNPDVYRGLFGLYRAERRIGEALQLLDDALGKSGKGENAGAAAKARAMMIALRDDSSLAQALLPVALQAQLSGERLQHQTRHYLAVLASRARQLDEAERLFRSCLNDGEIHPQAEWGIYSGLLRILGEARKDEAIVEVCQLGLRRAKATNRVLFHSELGRALVRLGRTEEALAEAEQAVNLADHDNRLFVRLNRVTVLRYAGRYEQAAAECGALLKEFRQPGEVRTIRHELSHVYSAARDYPQAEAQLQLLLEADPNDATAHNDLGYFWADQGKNLDEAERHIRKAIDLDRQQRRTGTADGPDADRDNAAYLDSLGWVLFRRGDVEAARVWLEKSAELPGGADDPVVWDHLGDVYARLGQPARATAAWRKALVLFETDRRRKADDHYREIKRKLELRP
jgi:tetratricopeptide (TPR) repeat protein